MNDGDLDGGLRVFSHGLAVRGLERARCPLQQVVPLVDPRESTSIRVCDSGGVSISDLCDVLVIGTGITLHLDVGPEPQGGSVIGRTAPHPRGSRGLQGGAPHTVASEGGVGYKEWFGGGLRR